jgi:hypothetical protein
MVEVRKDFVMEVDIEERKDPSEVIFFMNPTRENHGPCARG